MPSHPLSSARQHAPLGFLALLALLAACATPPTNIGHIPVEKGMEAVLGKPATAAFNLLGAPALDRQEGTARQLQFKGACTLDLYYYRSGTAEPAASYAAARLPNGQPLPPATCLAQLSARKSASSR